jgi:hypothetical protein
MLAQARYAAMAGAPFAPGLACEAFRARATMAVSSGTSFAGSTCKGGRPRRSPAAMGAPLRGYVAAAMGRSNVAGVDPVAPGLTGAGQAAGAS